VTVVNVDGGTLSLGSAGRFTDRPDVTVAAGAAIVLGGNEAFGSLAGAGTADLDRFTLTTGSRTSPAASAAHLFGSGALLKVGELTTSRWAAPTPSAAQLQVNQGTLALADGGTLGSGSDVTVATGATLSAGRQRQRRHGHAARHAGRHRHADGRDLHARGRAHRRPHRRRRAHTSSGASRVSGDVGATTVNVLADELTLASAGRLAPATTVVVADGARLTLGGDERVAALTVFRHAGRQRHADDADRHARRRQHRGRARRRRAHQPRQQPARRQRRGRHPHGGRRHAVARRRRPPGRRAGDHGERQRDAGAGRRRDAGHAGRRRPRRAGQLHARHRPRRRQHLRRRAPPAAAAWPSRAAAASR
jgi:hypothetical protein